MKKKKKRRLQLLQGQQQLDRLDGEKGKDMQLFEVIEARACMSKNRAADNNGIVAEHLKTLTFQSCVQVHKHFNNLYKGRETKHPKQWNVTPYTGIPKTKRAEAPDEYRWIANIDLVNQWYNRTWREHYRQAPNNVKNVKA